MVHPWESGLDNSPPYLDAGRRVHLTYKPQYERLDLLHVAAKNRPTNKDYDLFVWLLEQMRAQILPNMQQMELQLRRKLEEKTGGQIRSSANERVPTGYGDAVAEYFRKLSKGK